MVRRVERALGDLDENDPKSVARWMKKMGKEMGEDFGDDLDQAVREIVTIVAERWSGRAAEIRDKLKSIKENVTP